MCKHGPYSVVSGGKVKVERAVVLRWDKHRWLQEISFESVKGLVAFFAPLEINILHKEVMERLTSIGKLGDETSDRLELTL